MISRIYRLTEPRHIEMKQRELCIDNDSVIVKPEYLSICAADQRYFCGHRRQEVLNSKLPMALIHEAVGRVMYDRSGSLLPNEKVVLFPLDTNGEDSKVKANYRSDSVFSSSDADGFMRDFIALPSRRLIKISDSNSLPYVFTEILSVAIGAINALFRNDVNAEDTFGVWGDGSMGYITGLALRLRFPCSNILIFGKTTRRMRRFSYADELFQINSVPKGISIDHAFECVGGTNAENAIEQIIKMISPQGTINLLGVSEDGIHINTRTVLEKGLHIVGNSRSDLRSFEEAVRLIHDNKKCANYLRMLISDIVDVQSEDDIYSAFSKDAVNDFKTVINWRI